MNRFPSFNKIRQQREAFHIESRIPILLDFEFALDLADLILNTNTPDARMVAFAKRLQNLNQSDENDHPVTDETVFNR